MSRIVRQQRKALRLSKEFTPKRTYFGWARREAFHRLVWSKRFDFYREVFFSKDPNYHMTWAIGRIEILWARIEYSLDSCVSVIFHQLQGRSFSPEIPRSLSKKMTFIRKAFNKITALAPYKEQGIEILDKVKRLSEKRQDLTHGIALYQKGQINTNLYPFTKIDYKPTYHEVRNFNFDSDQFPALAKELSGLASDSIGFATELMNAFPIQKQ